MYKGVGVRFADFIYKNITQARLSLFMSNAI